MNNQKQKSLICKNDPHMGMPYAGIENVRYYSSDSAIPALRLNNTFQQLVDNDIYLENSLNNLSAYIPGPKTYDEQAIEAGSEGYKVWGPEADTQLSILRKVDVPLENTIAQAALGGQTVYWVQPIGNELWAGTNLGVYTSKDGAVFEMLASVPSYDIFNDSSVILIACEDGIYQASYEQCVENMGEGDAVVFRYFLRKRNANTMSGVRTVCFNPVSYAVFAGTISGIYYATLTTDSRVADMQFVAADLYDGDELLQSLKVNDVITLDHSQNPSIDASNDTVAATERGVFQSIQSGSVGNKRVRLPGKNCRCYVDFFGKRYVGTDAGVYELEGESRVASLSGVIYSAEQKPEHAFYGGMGGIWKVDGQGNSAWIGVETDTPVSWMKSCYLKNESGETVDALIMRCGTGNVYVYDVGNDIVTDVAEISGDCVNVQNEKAYYASAGRLNICGIAFGETYSSTKMESVQPYLTYGAVAPDIVDLQRSVNGNDLLVQTILVTERGPDGKVMRQCGCSGVTLFKTLNYDHSGYKYGMIDSGGLYLMTADFKRSNKVADATQFSDTENMIVFSNGKSISVRRESGEVVVARQNLESDVKAIECGKSGAFLLFESGSIAYYSEVRVLEKSGMMHDENIRCVAAVDDHAAVMVSTPERLAVYVKKSDGSSETPEFYRSVIPGASNSAFASGNIIYDCGPAGISAYGVTWSEPARIDQEPQEILFRGEDIRACVSSEHALYVASDTGLSSVSDGYVRRGEIVRDVSVDYITTFRGEDGGIVHIAATAAGLTAFSDDVPFGSIAVSRLADMTVQESDSYEFEVYTASDSGLVATTVTVLSGDIPQVGPARTIDPNMQKALSHTPAHFGLYTTNGRNVFQFDSNGTTPLTDMDGAPLEFGDVNSIAACQDGVLVIDGGYLKRVNVLPEAKCEVKLFDNIDVVRQVRVVGDTAVFLRSKTAYAVAVSEITQQTELVTPLANGVERIDQAGDVLNIVMSDGFSVASFDGYVLSEEYRSGDEILSYSEKSAVITRVFNVVFVHSYGAIQKLLIEGQCNNVFERDGTIYALSGKRSYRFEIGEDEPSLASDLILQAIAPTATGASGITTDGRYYQDISQPGFIEVENMPAVNAIADDSQVVRELFSISQIGVCTGSGLYDLSRTNVTVKEVPGAVSGNGYTLMKRTNDEVTAVQVNRIIDIVNQETVKSGNFTIKNYTFAGGHYYAKDPNGEWYGESTSGFAKIDALASVAGVLTIAYDYFTSPNSPLAVQRNAILKMIPAKVNTLMAKPSGRKSVAYSGDAEQIVSHSKGYTDDVYLVIKSGAYRSIYEYSYKTNTLEKKTYITATASSVTGTQDQRGSTFGDVRFAGDDADSDKIFAVMGTGTAICEDGDRFVHYDDMALQKIVLAEGGSVNYFEYSGGVYGVGTTSGLHQSTGNAETVQFRYVAQREYELRRFLKVTPRRYLIGSGYGLFTLQNSGADLTDAVFKNSSSNADVGTLTSFNVNGVDDTFTYTEGAQVYASYNARKWYSYMKLPQPVQRINDIIVRNKHLYYFATDRGLYRTNYAYALSNDIRKFTEEDAKRIYDGMEDDLVRSIDESIDEHERDWHGDSTDVATYLNANCLSVNFDGATAAGWGSVSYNQTSTEISISDDMVYEVFFGDESSGDLHVSVSNFLSSNGSVACSYVLKRYVSGMSELYIYVPTTCTQYVAHAYGVPNCKYYGREVERSGRFKQYGEQFEKFRTDIDQQYTSFTLFVDSAFAELSGVVDVQACPNSLPLNIYKDAKYQEAEGGASQLFHTLIKPTVVTTDVRSVPKNEDGEYEISFACFGSDAQALRVQFFDRNAGVGGETFKIEFRSNGANGSMAPQRVTIGTSKPLRPCSFTWDGDNQKVFSGWSLESDPEDNSTPTFTDRQPVSAADIEKVTGEKITNGKTVRMYAVWSTYKFGQSDTRFLMKSTQQEFYIDSADVNPATDLGGKVIIDYGD